MAVTSPVMTNEESPRVLPVLLGHKASLPVIGLQVIADDLGVGGTDRRPEGSDHLGHLRIPSGGVEKRRIHLDVIEAVAGGTVGLDLVDPGGSLELHGLFAGHARGCNSAAKGGGQYRDVDRSHGY